MNVSLAELMPRAQSVRTLLLYHLSPRLYPQLRANDESCCSLPVALLGKTTRACR